MRKAIYLGVGLFVIVIGFIVWSIFYTLTEGFPRLGLFVTKSSPQNTRLTAQDSHEVQEEVSSSLEGSVPLPAVEETPAATLETPPPTLPQNEEFSLIEATAQLNTFRETNPARYENEKKLYLEKVESNQAVLEEWMTQDSVAAEEVSELIRETEDTEVKVRLAQFFSVLSDDDRLEMIETLASNPSVEDQKVAIELYFREPSERGLVPLREIALRTDKAPEVRIYALQTIFRREQLADEDRRFLDLARRTETDPQALQLIQNLRNSLESKLRSE